jgi:hypothetical protein
MIVGSFWNHVGNHLAASSVLFLLWATFIIPPPFPAPAPPPHAPVRFSRLALGSPWVLLCFFQDSADSPTTRLNLSFFDFRMEPSGCLRPSHPFASLAMACTE